MKKIIFTQPNGGAGVVIPVMNTFGEPEGFTENDALKRAMKDIPEDATNVQVVEDSAIPKDRTFRNAWVVGNGCVEHDMAKAREIHRDILRRKRKPLLDALDVSYVRAQESGDTKTINAVVAQKQALRDATKYPAIDAAQTADELKAAIPAILA